MKKLLLSLVVTCLLTAGASATNASLAIQVEANAPAVVSETEEAVTEAELETEQTDVYFDAIELELEIVELDEEGDLESL